MSAYDSIHCVTLNQPTSHASWRADLTAQSLADMLGWNPDGEHVAKVLRTLQAGIGVEIYTRKVPMHHATNAVGYRFLPCTKALPEGRLPLCAKIERL